MLHPTPRLFAAATLVASLFSVASPARLGAQGARPARPARAPSVPAARVDQLMTLRERQATGVARLSPAERRALEAWLGRYTAAVRSGRPAAMARATTPAVGPATPAAPATLDTIRPAPGTRPAPALAPAQEQPTRIAIGFDPAPPALAVTAVYDDGDVIATADGSLWETYLPDRFNAGSWRAGQSLVVRSNPLPRRQSGPAYDVVLLNGETGTAVAARYAGRRREN